MLIDGGAEKRPSESISFRSGMVLALAKACEASAPGCGPCGAAGGGKCANAKENGGHALRTIHDKRTRTFVSRRSAPCGRAHTDMRTTEGTKEGTTIFAISRKFSPRDARRRGRGRRDGRFLRAPHREVPGVAGCVQAPDGETSIQTCPGRPLSQPNCYCRQLNSCKLRQFNTKNYLTQANRRENRVVCFHLGTGC